MTLITYSVCITVNISLTLSIWQLDYAFNHVCKGFKKTESPGI